MLKKIMMLALAIGALAALPSAAMGNWTDATENVGSNASLGLTGQFGFQGQLGSIQCQTESATQLTPGTTGHVNTFAVDANSTATNACSTGGPLAGCQVHTVQATGLPWVAHTNGTTIDITVGEIHTGLTGFFCVGPGGVTITSGTVQLTPNDPHAFSSGTLGGTVDVDVNSETSTSTVSGTQVVQGGAAGTYGIT